MEDSLSISQSISKESVTENVSVIPDHPEKSISNESITVGDVFLQTYRVTSEAMRGGMGSVWQVHHRDWNIDLAMKRPQPRFFAEAGEKKKEQFIAECENWISLGLHPNIVSCYCVREIGGVPTVFSEWMDNGSLKDRIKDGSLYEGSPETVQERILDIAIQSSRGLRYSHELGLVHQDVKPGNLLLNREWDAKAGDFGLAKASVQLEEGSDTAKTAGYTLAYCPEEQASGETPAKWMDVYAWGLTVLEMHSRKRLWETGADVKENLDEYFETGNVPVLLRPLLSSCIRNRRDGFDDELDRELCSIYRETVHTEYPRPVPGILRETAGTFNNRALSLLDLGHDKEAEQQWEKALECDLYDAESLFNYNLFLWRTGRNTTAHMEDMLRKIKNNAIFEECRRGVEKEAAGMLTAYDGRDISEGEKDFRIETAGEIFKLWSRNGAFVFTGRNLMDRYHRLYPVSGLETDGAVFIGAWFIEDEDYLLMLWARKVNHDDLWQPVNAGRCCFYVTVWDVYTRQEVLRRVLEKDEYSVRYWDERYWDSSKPWLYFSSDPQDFRFTPGEKTVYIVSSVVNAKKQMKEQSGHDRVIQEAQRAFREGKPMDALQILDDRSLPQDFLVHPARMRLRSLIGRDLVKTGIKRVVPLVENTTYRFDETEGEVPVFDLDDPGFRKARDELEEDIIERYRVHPYTLRLKAKESKGNSFLMLAEAAADNVLTGELEFVRGPAVYDTVRKKFVCCVLYDSPGKEKIWDPQRNIHLDKDGKKLYLANDALFVYDLEKGNRKVLKNTSVRTADILDNGRYVLCRWRDRTIHIIDTENGKTLIRIPMQGKDIDVRKIDDDCFAVDYITVTSKEYLFSHEGFAWSDRHETSSRYYLIDWEYNRKPKRIFPKLFGK